MSTTKQSNSLYPEVILTNPEAYSYSSTSSSMYPTIDSSQQSKPVYPEPGFASYTHSSSSMYPTVDMKDTAEKLFPDEAEPPVAHQEPYERVLVTVKGAIVNLIEREKSVELASGDLSIVSLYQGDNVVAVFARIGDEIQWPLAKDEVAVKLDESHYFFTLRVPDTESRGGEYEVLNYGVTVAAKGQESVLKEFDSVLETYGCFSVQEVRVSGNWEAVPKEISPEEMEKSQEKRDLMERSSVAYWTTLAPNVEDYSGTAAKLIAAGSGQLIRGILWCGDVTVDRLKWGDQFLRKRMGDKSVSEISPDTMKRIKRFVLCLFDFRFSYIIILCRSVG